MTDTIRCAMCLRGLWRWYYGMRAPVCAWCKDCAGPVRHPSLWGAAHLFSDAGRKVWQSYQDINRKAA